MQHRRFHHSGAPLLPKTYIRSCFFPAFLAGGNCSERPKRLFEGGDGLSFAIQRIGCDTLKQWVLDLSCSLFYISCE